MFRGRRVVSQQGIERLEAISQLPIPFKNNNNKESSERTMLAYHDNSRSTETTLTSITNRNPLLDRVRVLRISNSFDCYDVFPINANEWGDTGIHGGMVDFLRCRIDMGDDLLTI